MPQLPCQATLRAKQGVRIRNWMRSEQLKCQQGLQRPRFKVFRGLSVEAHVGIPKSERAGATPVSKLSL